MTELEENNIREYMYNDHASRMKAVHKNFKITRIYNVYFNILMSIVSIFGLYLWLSYTNAGIKHAVRMEEEIGAISFPFFGLTFFTVPIATVLSYIADVYLSKKLSRTVQIIYIGMLLFSVINLIVRFEPMHFVDLAILIVYSVLGIWTQDFAMRSYKELDYLKNQEGFPDFNHLIERDRHSKYVKYRDKWLNKEKKLDYFTENERPVTDYTVTASDDPTVMDGISISESSCSSWFEDKSPDAAQSVSDDMDSLETVNPEFEADEREYIFDDPRKRPL